MRGHQDGVNAADGTFREKCSSVPVGARRFDLACVSRKPADTVLALMSVI
jgi:hypothetical protein